ncbi:SulP family inorganic anion transporter [Bradyrhizobium sp. 2TAF24]|uniref:SulP family inorganic anion transporter n=1 Tax=Bradyrhizobium sp. 2TAF24 TaxID=3233011 RepID=UPI003F912D25
MRFKLLAGVLPLDRAGALRDALAGATLAAMNIPQVLGYARIAGMPTVTGLYTVLWPTVAFALFGASRHLVVAADSATATILSSKLPALAAPGSAEYVTLACMVALLTAGLLLLARIFRLGFLADFLSRTVLVGFLAGVGVQVGVAMLGDMLGIAVHSPRTIVQLAMLVQELPRVHIQTLLISAAVVITILGFRFYRPRWPVPFVIVLTGIVASYHLGFASRGIAVIGPVAGGMPVPRWPQVGWQTTLDLLPVAAACFAMIVAQSAAASRAFAEHFRERVDNDADILGLAAANAAAAVTGAFVVNGSPTQTATAVLAGARSQFAQLVFAAIVVAVLMFLSGWFEYLPHCVLAAVVFTIAVGLIDVRSLHAILRESPGEFGLAFVTAAAVVMIGVEQGILLAVALSLLRHVRHSYRPHTMMLMPGPDGRWRPAPVAFGAETAPGVIVYRFGADLFYANDHLFVRQVRKLIRNAPHPVRQFVIDAGAIAAVDYSAARSIGDLCRGLIENGVEIIFARVSPYLRADMERHHVADVLGEARIFATLHEALASIGMEAATEPSGPDMVDSATGRRS